jgi:REP-associated tyrosine transposase
MADIRAHVQQQKVLGDSRFQAEIEAMLDRKVAVRPRGRPRKADQVAETIETALRLPLEK